MTDISHSELARLRRIEQKWKSLRILQSITLADKAAAAHPETMKLLADELRQSMAAALPIKTEPYAFDPTVAELRIRVCVMPEDMDEESEERWRNRR